MVKESACKTGDLNWTPGLERSPGERNGIHSSMAWEIPWTVEPGGLQSMRLQKVRFDCVTNAFAIQDEVLT